MERDDLKARLREPSCNKNLLNAFATWKKYHQEGGNASWPRDQFEMLLDEIDDNKRDAADRIAALEAELAKAREKLAEASKWLGDVWPLLCPLKSEWQETGAWSDYDEEVFNRRATLNMDIAAALASIDAVLEKDER